MTCESLSAYPGSAFVCPHSVADVDESSTPFSRSPAWWWVWLAPTTVTSYLTLGRALSADGQVHALSAAWSGAAPTAAWSGVRLPRLTPRDCLPTRGWFADSFGLPSQAA